jgi:hypothetical protein
MLAFTAAALAFAATPALAQNVVPPPTPPASQPAQQGPQNAPIKNVNENNASAPVAGANSFTEAQAKKQIEAKGYTNVSALVKDKDGIWRGTAVKDGKTARISVDYQGNVN